MLYQIQYISRIYTKDSGGEKTVENADHVKAKQKLVSRQEQKVFKRIDFLYSFF